MPLDKIAEEKALDRQRDFDRIAKGEATPMQIQLENSAFTLEFAQNAKIIESKEFNRRMSSMSPDEFVATL